MGASKRLKMIMLDKGVKKQELAAILGVERQVLYNMLSRDTMKWDMITKIANTLGCEVIFKDKETGKEY